MKKLEDVLNYVLLSPICHGIGLGMATNSILSASEGNWNKFAMNAAFTVCFMGLGYADFRHYKKAKKALEQGWNEETIDGLVNWGGWFSRYIVGTAAKQTGYSEEFKELSERKDYRLFRKVKLGGK